MSISGVGFQNFKYYGHIGVDNEGNPVYYDPKKAKAKKPIFIDFKENVTPEQRKIIAEKLEAKIRQQEAIEKALNDHGRINPLKDKVYLDENGELTTWKPGIIDPHREEKEAAAKKKLAGLAAALITAGLAFIFRGKIKNGAKQLLEAVKPYLKGAVVKGKDLIKKGIGLAKPVIEKAGKAVKEVAKKGAELVKPAVAYVKNGAGKVVNYVKNLVK